MTNATKRVLEQLQKLEATRQAAIKEQVEIIRQAKEMLVKLGYRAGEKVTKKRAVRRCSLCGKTGHTKRTCPKKS
jgi:DNA-binding protein H-NS